MNKRRYILRSLFFYRRTNLGVVLGAALAGAVLTGALMVGDSVRHSLEQLTLSRLGGIDFVLVSGERFFQADLAERLRAGTSRPAAALILDGVALTPTGDRRIGNVQVVGVDDAFWAFAPQPMTPPRMEPGTCRVNQAFADRLPGAEPGQTFILRVRKPGGLPADLTLAATREESAWSRRLRIDEVAGPAAFGHFTLRTTQIPPPTVFVPRSWLSDQLGIGGRANALLVADPEGRIRREALQERLEQRWRLADAGLRVEPLENGTTELQSERVFIAAPVVKAARQVANDMQPVLTYFVNRIVAGERATPYSFASAPGPPRVPETLADDETRIGDWLAQDLGIGEGARVTLEYYAVDSGSRLEERTATFTVAAIVSTEKTAERDRTLAPRIPGLSDADHCRDWDPGIPIELDRIRDKDEVYWNEYGPLPKLYLSLSAAESLWSNRFGTYTALRFPAAAGAAEEVAEALRARLRARAMGFVFQAAKQDGLAASRDAVDFGQLFVGLSFFLIVAAILLTVLLFSFNVQYRAEETGTLRALGWPPGTVARLFAGEGLILVAAGAALGAILARGYNALILRALQTLWHEAVRTSAFQAQVRPISMVVGAAVVIGSAMASLGLAVRQQTRYTIRDLQQGESGGAPSRTAGRGMLVAGLTGALAATGLAVAAPVGQGREALGVFFGSGSLLLLSLLALCDSALRLAGRTTAQPVLNRRGLLLRGAGLRRGRSLACIALLALGVFLVIAVAANRRGPVRDPDDPASGTGGYRIWGQTTLPLAYDPGRARGRAAYGLPPELADEAQFTTLRLREGDDASCLNLNRVATPHILGVDPAEFDRRGAFTFAQWVDSVDPDHPWRALERDMGPDIVPVVADAADIVWGLGKSVGDTLPFTDEGGRAFQVKIVAGLAHSIFQGHLIMAEQQMKERFPTQSGPRVLLVETSAASEDRIQSVLSDRLSDIGLASLSTQRRLAEFNSVENTYLSIFMLLGGLGVLVGSAGMGVVAARNILERRSELALLRAVGFRRRRLRRLIFAEHGGLAAAGVAVGGVAALVAAAPALLAPGAEPPWAGVWLTLGAVLAGSWLWIWLAVRIALRGDLNAALRNE